MIIYKIVMMSGQEVVLENKDDLTRFLAEANSGKKLVLTKHGIVNVASIDSIVEHKELMSEVWNDTRLGTPREEAINRALPKTSPFAELLGNENKRLGSD